MASSDQVVSVIIVGAGGHACVVADVVRLHPTWRLLGLISSDLPKNHHRPDGLAILGGMEVVATLAQQPDTVAVVAIGHCATRLRVADEVAGVGMRFVAVVHAQAIVAGDVTIGAGTVVAAGAVINPRCRVAEHVIINTGALLESGAIVEQGAHVAPGAIIGAGAVVGAGALVGVGAIVTAGFTLGPGVVVGVGAVVESDVPRDVTVVGRPALALR